MKLNNKEKVEVFLTLDVKEKLKLKAQETGLSMATIIKLALGSYLK